VTKSLTPGFIGENWGARGAEPWSERATSIEARRGVSL
jgi:hypothetical protein